MGYGHIGGEIRRTLMAHRVSWELHYGPPGAFLVCHRCDNPSCVNPEHLFLGTDADNARDRDSKGRLGRRDGEFNGRAKLSRKDADLIRLAYETLPVSQPDIAKAFAVHLDTVHAVIRGKRWVA